MFKNAFVTEILSAHAAAKLRSQVPGIYSGIYWYLRISIEQEEE